MAGAFADFEGFPRWQDPSNFGAIGCEGCLEHGLCSACDVFQSAIAPGMIRSQADADALPGLLVKGPGKCLWLDQATTNAQVPGWAVLSLEAVDPGFGWAADGKSLGDRITNGQPRWCWHQGFQCGGLFIKVIFSTAVVEIGGSQIQIGCGRLPICCPVGREMLMSPLWCCRSIDGMVRQVIPSACRTVMVSRCG